MVSHCFSVVVMWHSCVKAPAREPKGWSCRHPKDCECLEWGPLQPAAALVTVPVSPGSSPALEGGVIYGSSALSPWCSPEPLWDPSCAKETIPGHWQQLSALPGCIPHTSAILWYPELLHCSSIPPAAQVCVWGSTWRRWLGLSVALWELLAFRPYTSHWESYGCYGNFCQEDKV